MYATDSPFLWLKLEHYVIIITSPNQVGKRLCFHLFLPVCLFVCLQDISRSYKRILKKLQEKMCLGRRRQLSEFRGRSGCVCESRIYFLGFVIINSGVGGGMCPLSAFCIIYAVVAILLPHSLCSDNPAVLVGARVGCFATDCTRSQYSAF